jgi:hypothetical protein
VNSLPSAVNTDRSALWWSFILNKKLPGSVLFFLNLDIDDVTAVEFGLLAGGFVIIEGALDLR